MNRFLGPVFASRSRSGGILVAALCLLIACESPTNRAALQGSLIAHFKLNDSTCVAIPALQGEAGSLTFLNGEESISLVPVSDSVFLVPVFGGSVIGSWDDGVFSGHWTDSLRTSDYRIPVAVTAGAGAKHPGTIELPERGSWQVTFGKGDGQYTGELLLSEGLEGLTGTVLTETGDYRFLSGELATNGQLRLQTFDGAHLFLFTAQWEAGDWVDGHFYSGSHYHTSWVGSAREQRRLYAPQSKALCAEPLVFTDAGGRRWDSLSWASYDAVVIDIVGTWCPNCMDESRLLKTMVENRPEVLVLSVAFERGTDSARIDRRLKVFRSALGLDWAVIHGGPASKQVAAQVFSQLGGVTSFPTTLFHDPQTGQTRVHSGFAGPATGSAHGVEAEAFGDYLSRCLGNN